MTLEIAFSPTVSTSHRVCRAIIAFSGVRVLRMVAHKVPQKCRKPRSFAHMDRHKQNSLFTVFLTFLTELRFLRILEISGAEIILSVRNILRVRNPRTRQDILA